MRTSATSAGRYPARPKYGRKTTATRPTSASTQLRWWSKMSRPIKARESRMPSDISHRPAAPGDAARHQQQEEHERAEDKHLADVRVGVPARHRLQNAEQK